MLMTTINIVYDGSDHKPTRRDICKKKGKTEGNRTKKALKQMGRGLGPERMKNIINQPHSVKPKQMCWAEIQLLILASWKLLEDLTLEETIWVIPDCFQSRNTYGSGRFCACVFTSSQGRIVDIGFPFNKHLGIQISVFFT